MRRTPMSQQPIQPPLMEDKKWYDLDPPARWGGKTFYRVQCEYRVPNRPNEYSVKGVPEGGKTAESFILIFTSKGKTQIKLSENQE